MEWLFILLGVALVILIIIFILCSYTKAGPDEAIMISGLGKRKILRGKAGWKIPFLQRKDRLSLKLTLRPVNQSQQTNSLTSMLMVSLT